MATPRPPWDRCAQLRMVGRDLASRLEVTLRTGTHPQGLEMVGQSDVAVHVARGEAHSILKGLHHGSQVPPLLLEDGGEQ